MFKVVLWGTVCTLCSTKWYREVFQMSQARVSNKSVLQECFRALRESVLPACATRVSSKSVSQECLRRLFHKSVPQECPTGPTRVCHKSVAKECSARVAFNAIEHLLFAFHCSVGTLLLRELLKNACGLVASIRFIFLFRVKTFGYRYQWLAKRVYS